MKPLTPRILLRFEGLAVLTATLVFYRLSHYSWVWFSILILAPDIFLLGYLAGKKVGAAVYNSVHTYVAPLLLLGVLLVTNKLELAWMVLIWIAHIGIDRLVGYGLKYESGPKETHLQRV